MPTALCFGELLWDHLPAGPRLGGAPANVAHHLAQLGLHARLASCIGEDDEGRRALAILAAAGVDVALVARNPLLPTGRVTVQMDADGAPRYRIDEGVAWDAIVAGEALRESAAEAAALVFGTLAQRSAANRATLAALLDAAPQALVVCDLNFRPPFVDAASLRTSLERAAILKLNEDELAALPGLLALPAGTDFAERLRERFALRRIYLTRAAQGCRVIDGEGARDAAAPAVTVADSVGAGDAFTAVLVQGELRGLEPARIAADACAAGAWVASQAGAMPDWPRELRERLLAK